jgi:two-component system CheB/CheR fusion protein
LGLSISKGLIELLGGAITAVSTPEKGSEFKIEIPYMPVENTIVNPKANALPDKFFFHGKTILIVEDEDNNLKYLATILGRISANLILAKNGEEAIEKFKLHPETDLILMDIRMPLKNGDEAAIEILKIKTDAKIIALTAYAMSGDKEKYLKMGFVDYISKPVKKDELFQKIAYWIQ